MFTRPLREFAELYEHNALAGGQGAPSTRSWRSRPHWPQASAAEFAWSNAALQYQDELHTNRCLGYHDPTEDFKGDETFGFAVSVAAVVEVKGSGKFREHRGHSDIELQSVVGFNAEGKASLDILPQSLYVFAVEVLQQAGPGHSTAKVGLAGGLAFVAEGKKASKFDSQSLQNGRCFRNGASWSSCAPAPHGLSPPRLHPLCHYEEILEVLLPKRDSEDLDLKVLLLYREQALPRAGAFEAFSYSAMALLRPGILLRPRILPKPSNFRGLQAYKRLRVLSMFLVHPGAPDQATDVGLWKSDKNAGKMFTRPLQEFEELYEHNALAGRSLQAAFPPFCFWCPSRVNIAGLQAYKRLRVLGMFLLHPGAPDQATDVGLWKSDKNAGKMFTRPLQEFAELYEHNALAGGQGVSEASSGYWSDEAEFPSLDASPTGRLALVTKLAVLVAVLGLALWSRLRRREPEAGSSHDSIMAMEEGQTIAEVERQTPPPWSMPADLAAPPGLSLQQARHAGAATDVWLWKSDKNAETMFTRPLREFAELYEHNALAGGQGVSEASSGYSSDEAEAV
eukprot:s7514_g2.t1